MLKFTVLGEKLMKASTAGSLCCWGGPDDGCDCTGGGNFSGSSNVWLARLDKTLTAIEPNG
jgi:hypothetical protein